MKTKLLFIVILALGPVLCALSQVPQGFNYQAIARDNSGNPIVGATIKVKLSVLSDTTGFKANGTGTYLLEEEHVKTNAYGLFTVAMGTGTKILGSAATFSAINWNKAPVYFGTKIANPTTYKIMGSAKAWSVPFAMVAKGLDGTTGIKIKGGVVNADSTLFEVKNSNGQTIFAVYQEGVRIFVDDGAKGAKGGFAVGGFGTAKAPSQEYLRITRDSARIYINDLPGKPAKGGFAVGGFGTTKSIYDKFFAVDLAKISAGKVEYIKLDPVNTFIGEQAGNSTVVSGDNGKYNSFIGFQSGFNNTLGHHNTYIGWKAGYQVGANAHYNVFIGNSSGYYTTGSNNVFIGERSGNRNTSGNLNVFIGLQAGQKNKTGNNNMFIGSNAGQSDSTGGNNTFLGTSAGQYNISGSNNVYIGWRAGSANDNNTNTIIGVEAGAFSTGSGNVFIGYRAGQSEAGSNKLFISNSSTSNLVQGDFTAKTVTINDILILTPRATAPATPVPGMVYVNSVTNHIFCYINGAWRQLDN
jgi:hypothetical protein